MIFGDPYRFAIWIEYIPEWDNGYKNGFFYYFINGNMYPKETKTATLSTDLFSLLGHGNALYSPPIDKSLFGLCINDIFSYLNNLVYPEPTEENEYPEQDFSYLASTENIEDEGSIFFAVTNGEQVRIIGGKIQILSKVANEDIYKWEKIKSPTIEDVIISNSELLKIISEIKKYSKQLFKK